jgi:hypothetical protein
VNDVATGCLRMVDLEPERSFHQDRPRDVPRPSEHLAVVETAPVRDRDPRRIGDHHRLGGNRGDSEPKRRERECRCSGRG